MFITRTIGRSSNTTPGRRRPTRREYASRAMRAATIRDGQIAVEEHPDPEPQDGQLLVRVRAAGLNGADMHAARRAATRRRPARRRTSRGSSSPARWSTCGRRRRALRAGRPRDGDRRRRRPGRAGGGPRARGDAGARTSSTGPPRAASPRSSPPRTTRSSPRPALTSASACSSTARRAASAWPPSSSATMAGARVTATVRDEHCARAGRRARRARRSRPRASSERGPVRRDPRARRRARTCPANLDALATGGRICVIGVGAGAQGRDRPAPADGQARRASTARRCAPARSRTRRRPRGWWRSRCCPGSSPATSRARSPRPSRSTRSPAAYERFQAGGKLGKIVLLP